jgi:polyisoprenyl-teichoic acid--peptidoglycan teichoic acid transferase
MSSNSHDRREPPRIQLPLWALAILGSLLIIIVMISVVWLFRTVRDIAAATTTDTLEFILPDEENSSAEINVSDQEQETVEEPLPVIVLEEIESWSGEERINFLFLGVDQRCNEDGPTHTDSIIIATVDPVSMSAALLSLPRDLWVEIPGFGVDRVNQAYYFGQAYEYPGGGQALAMETVEALLGIPVDYYVTVNFQGFVNAVDLIGGIQLNVPEAIDDPDYPDNCYGYDPFSIEEGFQRLNGQTALKYARTRATFGGDVDRAQRQQHVLLAVRDQILNLNQLPRLFIQAPQLWRTFQDNLDTNLALEDALELALLVQEIPPENIKTAVLDFNFVYNETTPDGRQVLVPVRDEIRGLRDELFAPPAVPAAVIENLPELMVEEGARIALQNGTAVFGLAAETQSYLEDLGVNVVEIGNADSATYSNTQIIDYGDHDNTVLFLIQELQLPPLNASSISDPDPTRNYDLLIIIGNDWANRMSQEQ